MGLFGKNQEENQERPINPNNMLMIRLLAIGYLMYLLYNMVTAYITGSEEAPSIGLLIAAIVIFVGGSVWIGIITYKQYKRLKAAQQAAWEEEDRLEAEAAAQAQNEEDYEEISDDAKQKED